LGTGGAGRGAAELDDAADRGPQRQRVHGGLRGVVRRLRLYPLRRGEGVHRLTDRGEALLHRADQIASRGRGLLVGLLTGVDLRQQGRLEVGVGDHGRLRAGLPEGGRRVLVGTPLRRGQVPGATAEAA
jgi:hypothetical protein